MHGTEWSGTCDIYIYIYIYMCVCVSQQYAPKHTTNTQGAIIKKGHV